MTLIVLAAVLLDRRALTMRNLALAVLAIVALEPEAILGVSFQLSFAAVGALVAVMEARLARAEEGPDPFVAARGRARPGAAAWLRHLFDKPIGLARRDALRDDRRPPRSCPIISTISAPMC